jgi:hypothetical protein
MDINQEMSAYWAMNTKTFDGDNRTPYEVYDEGLITYREFIRCLFTGGCWI